MLSKHGNMCTNAQMESLDSWTISNASQFISVFSTLIVDQNITMSSINQGRSASSEVQEKKRLPLFLH